MSQAPANRPNALSNYASGGSYTSLGCFPLGTHMTHTDANELITTLHQLRTRHILQPIPAAILESVKKQLAPLQEAQCFWAHHARDAPQARAVGELIECLAHAGDGGSEKLKLYLFPDSARLSSTAPQMWGLHELDVNTRITYLYISAKSMDLAGTVLHTFLSSRRCSRSQCFLSEYVLADQAGRLSDEWELPPRMEADIDALERGELEGFLERLEMEGSLEAPVLFAKLRGYCEEILERTKPPIWWADEEEPWS